MQGSSGPENTNRRMMSPMTKDKLRRLVCFLPILLAACSEPMAWIRTDGRPMDGGLAQLKEIDTLACRGGESEKKGDADSVLSALRLKKTDDGAFATCMAARGYLRVPLSGANAASRK
jgi:hypothetical protein